MTHKILVVDDEPNTKVLFQEKFNKNIKSKKFQLIFAGDGMEALEKLEEHPDIELVLADINMPRMDGLTLLSEINKLDRIVLTIIVTAYGDMENIRRAMNKSAYDFLIKPLNFKDMKITIKRAFDDIRKRNENIEKRKQAEKKRAQLEKQLRQSRKMEAIGTLAGGIAHDFNNILFAILGYITMAKQEVTSESVKSDLEEALQAGNRAKDLVRQILTFSRQEENEFIPIEITSILKEALKFLRSSIPNNIDIQSRISPEKHSLIADPTQIYQIVVNLCTNAVQAMRETNGKLMVTLEQVEIDSWFASQHSLQNGMYCKLSVSDTGTGIASEFQEKIFEPFFTTKPIGKGTGLGLSVVHGIVKKHSGAITVTSELGKGTAFDVYLPVIFKETSTEAEKEKAFAQGKGRIMIVDDEFVLMKLEKLILERCGYEVVGKTSSMEALKHFKSEPDAFDLVVTDQTMPKMSGLELAKEIHLIQPDIAIILLTGNQRKISPNQIKESGIRELVLKPIEPGSFSHLVHRILVP